MEHKAGRELDALIAEKVMGWRFMSRPVEPLLPPLVDGAIRAEDLRWRDSGGFFVVPPYSTDIAAAWELLNKIHPYALSIGYQDNCWLVSASRKLLATADTAPLAICLAALKAVEGE